jgi:hypothetical protein
MAPLLLILSLETWCLGLVLILVRDWSQTAKSRHLRTSRQTGWSREVLIRSSIGLLLAPAVLSLLGIVPALLGAGTRISDVCAIVGGCWVHDAFPKGTPWQRLVWQALAMSIEMLLFLKLATGGGATTKRQSGGDVAQYNQSRVGAAEKPLVLAASGLLLYHWASVVFEGIRRLNAQ